MTMCQSFFFFFSNSSLHHELSIVLIAIQKPTYELLTNILAQWGNYMFCKNFSEYPNSDLV